MHGFWTRSIWTAAIVFLLCQLGWHGAQSELWAQAPGDITQAAAAPAVESHWLEAEHFTGISGYCWPMGPDNLRQTKGSFGLSGPGWAAEWNQGGESGFLSIAAGPAETQASVRQSIEIAEPGTYHVWVRYGDWREKREPFQVSIEQPGQSVPVLRFGETPVVEEDNEAKLYWGWAFGWGHAACDLVKGPASVVVACNMPGDEPRQLDAVVLTTDASYRPLIKNRPAHPTWAALNAYRGGEGLTAMAPLARNPPPKELPAAWKVKTFKDQGFLYLWNVSETGDTADWFGTDANRVKVPYSVRDPELIEAFRKKYAGRDDVPIFSDPRIVPAFHGVGPGIFATDAQTGEVQPAGKLFASWLDANPARKWATMMNYHPGKPVGDQGVQLFQKYRDRYVGAISGESLGYFYPDAAAMKAATEQAASRRALVEAFTPLTLSGNREKYRAIYGRDLDANPYEDVISCMSVGNIVFAPLLSRWGCRTIGYESSAATSSVLGMRWAFMRGIARQGGHTTATYRSCNFGDSSTIFSNTGSYHTPQSIYDNYYSVFSGAGMTWYKMDIWYQYMAGSSMFYHEQGFDEFWRPGGTTVAGVREIELSPKGKLVDRFLRVTAQHPDRGSPYTPVALLVDFAHGWEPAPFWPNAFKNWHGHENRFTFGDHERMLEEWFWTAFHPIGPESEKPMTGTNEVYVPSVFGDIFDVVCAYPEAERWTTLNTYPVVIVTGDIELSAAEGAKLAEYVANGGTLLVCDAHLTGPGLAALQLPAAGEARESAGFTWMEEKSPSPSQRFRYKPITVAADARVLAKSDSGEALCVAEDRGAGRLVYLAVPRGLGLDRRAIPLVPRLVAQLSRGLMPVEVQGDVEWLVNRGEGRWLVTLLNPAGQDKPQQGITPTDYRENRTVTIRSQMPVASASDWLQPSESLPVQPAAEGGSSVQLIVPAGGVRIIELQ